MVQRSIEILNRSCNWQTNLVFHCIHSYASNHQCFFITWYITSSRNLANAPSQGVYLSLTLLLPIISIPPELQPFIVNLNHHSLL